MVDDVLQNIEWLGHDGFLIRGAGKVIYIDPYKIGNGLPKADLILISHEHYDHCSLEDIKKVQTDQTIYVTEKDSALKISGDVRVMKPGEKIDIGAISIQALPAYNLNKKFHPKKKGWLGFVLRVDGVSIYHAGDTDHIPEMKSIQTDIALLPVSGTYVMTAEEAIAAAQDIQPVVAIPMHCGSLVGSMEDAQDFAAGLAGKIRVSILP